MSFDLKIKNGDLSIKDGALEKVTGQDKLVQDILKICLTSVGSNPFQPWYGSYVNRSLIGYVIDDDVILNLAQNQLQNAIENLQKLQKIQATESLQKVSPDEQIAGITSIQVNRNTVDLRLFEVLIKILNRSFKQVTTNFTVSPF